MKKRIMVDMDDTLCDFMGGHREELDCNPKQRFPQSKWGFFSRLKPIEGAIWGFKELEKHFDVWILTRPSTMNVNSYSEKAQWVWDHLGYNALERTIYSCDKSLIKGDYLIDDMGNAGQDRFEGNWIRFGTGNFCTWREVVNYIFEKEGIKPK